jgi:hypothetical protein
MIKVTITQDGERLDAIEFDADNVIASAGGLRVVFRDAMQDCSANGLWHRVTHAAGTVAGRSYLRGADEPPESVIDAPLSILDEARDLPPDHRDDIEQNPGDRADNDLYHVDRDPDETGDRASRSLPAIYKLWQWPKRSKDRDLP